ncbi:carboxypeptidase regulatory-like domain-containing protein [Chitinophaga sp. G-6-1-13]|uniref:Carboxypeptidase regulatory-like domain-containing protein n=1 Tax=Chitinophaga fulva TaxID=2728842 RepID=A0A848GLM3_9BACT|nr:carboxypeptidase-like regulatory domain-containing protein [Chitinophaga fulva]NML39276.1 carboxypeptidase regulatory-like domain-containing protein [Chitinophaga fulva]
MKKTITGMLAFAAVVVGMSSFKSADATTVRSLDSASVKMDSLMSVDSVARFDSLSMGIDSLMGLDSVARVDSFSHVNAVSKMDSLFRNDSLRMDSVKGMDSLRTVEGGSISGKVTPADGAAEVEADNGSEKLKGAVSQGAFAIPAAKAGTYTITIVGKAPYKSAVIKDVKVQDGKATDLGEIKLEQ